MYGSWQSDLPLSQKRCTLCTSELDAATLSSMQFETRNAEHHRLLARERRINEETPCFVPRSTNVCDQRFYRDKNSLSSVDRSLPSTSPVIVAARYSATRQRSIFLRNHRQSFVVLELLIYIKTVGYDAFPACLRGT